MHCAGTLWVGGEYQARLPLPLTPDEGQRQFASLGLSLAFESET